MVRTLRTPSLARGASLLLLAAGACVAEAGYGFLAKTRLSRSFVETELRAELNALLGHGASHARLERFMDSMRPMYDSLPKNKTGHVDQGVARYALHRYFLSHHGWHIRGLAPNGERWSASSSTSMLKSKVPDFVLELFAGRPFDLETLAVLAATVEDLIHGDTYELLRMAYKVHGYSLEEPLANMQQEELVIKTYLIYFILPWTQEELTNSTELQDFLVDAHYAYPGWENTLLWVEDLKGAIRHRERTEHSPFSWQDTRFRSFPSMAQLMEQVIDGIGMFQNIECHMMKNKLMDLQDSDRTDGRVRLGKFYEDFLAEREYWFTESPEFLKNLGALDDSDPSSLSVIVPNILYARSNCLATSSGFHSLCCVNQCDALMESIERGIAHPVASPSALAKLVSSLPSETIAAPRNLSGSLLQKLGRIAEQHAGRVPLHGRLFAQWLHHAFPNECPFPQLPGAEAPLTHQEWTDRWQKDSTASVEVMRRFVNEVSPAANASVPSVFDEEALTWTDDEELVTDLDFEQWGMQFSGFRRPSWIALLSALRFAAMSVAAAATLAIFWDSLRSSGYLARPAGALEKTPPGGVLRQWLGQARKPEWI